MTATVGHAVMSCRTRLVASSILVVGALAFALAGCSSSNSSKSEDGYSPRVVKLGEPVPPGGGVFKVGSTYSIKGRSYTPRHQPDYDEVGLASWYGADFHGRRTANGEIYDMGAFSAAHKTLPLPVYARVTNLENGKSVVVRINDRGPFAHGRIIDLSKKTADILEFKHQGTAKVRVQYVGRAPLDGQDEWLTTTVRNGGTDQQVAAIDREIASRAFASDGDRGANRQNYQMAASAYRGGRMPRQSPAPAMATEPARQPTMVAESVPGVEAIRPIPAENVVQAGIYANAADAQAIAASLAGVGRVSVEDAGGQGAGAYRVALRPHDPSESLESLLLRTQMAGIPGAVIATTR